MLTKISKWATIIFAIFWLFFIALDYWATHAVYSSAIGYFQFWGLLLLLLGLCGGLSFWVSRNRNKATPSILFSGIGIYLLFSSLAFIAVGAQTMQLDIPLFTGGAYFSVWLNLTLLILGITLVLVLPAYSIGNFIIKKLNNQILDREETIVSIAVGLSVLTFLLFMIATFGGLQWFIILPVFLLPAIIFWRNSLAFLQLISVNRFAVSKEMNWLGASSLVWLLFFVVTSCLQLVRPYPFGFDALSLYMNLASLINDYQGLVAGFQPYNWSLLMSIGYTVFGMTEFALGISQLGVILSVFALYALSRRWLNVNHALLTSLLFYSLPTVIFQTYKDMKIDMGLLFISLTMMIVFVNWVAQVVKIEGQIPSLANLAQANSASTEDNNSSFLKKNNLIITLGILAGFAMGIKFTSLFLIFGILGGIWYVHSGKIGLITVFLLSFAILLIGRVDDMSGARKYHLGADTLQWILLIGGLILTAMLFVGKREQLLKSMRISVLFGSLLIISFIHWPVKNAVESEKISVKALLFGKRTGPGISPIEIQQNWRAQQGN
ncbi:MAG: hypothetical protein AB8G22_25645 [Saprospiraceae bacterium]